MRKVSGSIPLIPILKVESFLGFMIGRISMRRPTVVHCDKAVNWQVGFQDPATPIAEGIIRFHHDRMIILTGVVVFVG